MIKKFRGLVIPKHTPSDDRQVCCNCVVVETDLKCYNTSCYVCMFDRNNINEFNKWIKLNRPCEICDEKENSK